MVLVQYATKIHKANYHLARVAKVHLDPHGIVGTITVAMRPRDSREKISQEPPHLKANPATLLWLGGQRVIVILPVEEQNPNGKALNLESEPFLPNAPEVEVLEFQTPFDYVISNNYRMHCSGNNVPWCVQLLNET